jgi:hypothetical protein
LQLHGLAVIREHRLSGEMIVEVRLEALGQHQLGEQPAG